VFNCVISSLTELLTLMNGNTRTDAVYSKWHLVDKYENKIKVYVDVNEVKC